MEVLVSMLIMVIGITSVIALFPVGIIRVRNAVVDTRTTIMAQNAKNVILARQMTNDPALIRLDVDTSGTNARKLDVEENNLFAWLVNTTAPNVGGGPALPLPRRYLLGMMNGQTGYFVGSNAEATFAYQPLTPNEVLSFPILVDPFLYEALAVPAARAGSLPTTDPVRIRIGDYYTNAPTPVNSPYYDIRIASLAEIHGAPLAPLTASSIAALPGIVTGAGSMGTANVPVDSYRSAYITRWFASLSDVAYAQTNVVLPTNPQGTSPAVTPGNYLSYDYASPTPTVDRKYPYTWAFMMQRPMGLDPDAHLVTAGNTNRSVRRPARNDAAAQRTNVLCFNRRNLAAPQKAVTVIEGCIFNGSKKITLSWPSLTARPEIKKGTWICEASVSRRTLANPPGYTLADSGTLESGYGYPGATAALPLQVYRRAFNFFKIVDYDDPEIIVDRVYQRVTIDRTPQGYPTVSATGDLRGNDLYAAPSWPLQMNPTLTPNPTTAIFYPILIFDGLVEVF